MALKLTPTQYKVTHQGWAYTVHQGYRGKGWIVHRRREEHANIPPLMRVWTEKGWVPMLSEDSHNPKLFETAEAASRMIEEQNDE